VRLLRHVFILQPLSSKPEASKITEIKFRIISRVEKDNYVRKPLTPPLECVRIVRTQQSNKAGTPTSEFFFFQRGEKTIW
jgi:hypothetical protein